jgi:hypothetical protein
MVWDTDDADNSEERVDARSSVVVNIVVGDGLKLCGMKPEIGTWAGSLREEMSSSFDDSWNYCRYNNVITGLKLELFRTRTLTINGFIT